MLIVDKVMSDLLQTSAKQNNRPLNEQIHSPKRESIGYGSSLENKTPTNSLLVSPTQSGSLFKVFDEFFLNFIIF